MLRPKLWEIPDRYGGYDDRVGMHRMTPWLSSKENRHDLEDFALLLVNLRLYVDHQNEETHMTSFGRPVYLAIFVS